MDFTGFVNEDFEVFEVPGLEPRMDVLKARVRPKLEQLGRDFGDWLTTQLGVPVYAHVAKHARRTVNPPNDTWVAFCTDKRGYKKHPHFQIGLWQSHVFATFGLIYESPVRGIWAAQLQRNARRVVKMIPKDYVWIPDHTDPAAISASAVKEKDLLRLADKLGTGRQGELLVGRVMSRQEVIAMTPKEFEARVQTCFETIQPLYEMAVTQEARV